MLAAIATAGPSHASAWNPEARRGEVISGFVQTTADRAKDEFGRNIAIDSYFKYTSQNYGIVGLTDRWALLTAFDWQDVQIRTDSVDVAFSKPSKIQAGLQYQLVREGGRAIALSASYLDGIDLPDALLSLEDRRSGIELRGLWGEGRVVQGMNVFAEAQLSARFDLDARLSNSQAQMTVGITPVERLQFIGKARAVSLRDGTFERLAIAGQERWEVEASAVLRVRKKTFAEVGYVATVRAENAVRERGIKVGLWTKF